jgi:hypothetical protein
MADRKQKPVWVRSFHPADTEKNLEALYESLEVLLPDYPVISKDLDDAVEVTAAAEYKFDLTVEDVARGTLTYQWQIDNDGEGFDDITGATSVDYTVASWDDTANAGTYRCKITNTLNGVTAVTYSNECVATTAEAAG